MKSFALVLSSIILLGACSTEPNVVHVRTEKGQKETKSLVDANRLMTLEIKGMSCEMGCGGSIRKELKATGGVARVEFDFVEGEKTQTAKISFDKNKVKEDEMVKIITSMNDQQFTVNKTSSENISYSTTTPRNTTPDSEEEKVKISSTSFALPNLFDILSRIIK